MNSFFNHTVYDAFIFTTRYQLQHIKGIIVNIDNYLNSQVDRIKKNSQSLEEISKGVKNEQYAEHVFEGQIEEYQFYNDTFPDVIRKSLFIYIYSYLESELKNVCKFIEYRSDPLKLSDINGQGIEKIRTYLTKAIRIELPTILNNDFEFKFINLIRHHLVHANGEFNINKINEFKGLKTKVDSIYQNLCRHCHKFCVNS